MMASRETMESKILVVDDIQDNLDLMVEVLEDGPWTIATARDAVDALQQASEGRFDLLLLDVHMPEMDGYELCRRLRRDSYTQNVPVIFVTAERTSTDNVIEGLDAGGCDYITKPFDQAELMARVRVMLRLRTAEKRLRAAQAALDEQNRSLSAVNEGLERAVQERTAQVVATRDVTVFSLAKLAESRDTETGNHLQRLRAYSQLLAKRLRRSGPYTAQIDDDFLADLYRSSPLHDIGKVGIPDAILLKPGRLSDEEFEIMKRHAVIGADTLDEAAGHTGAGGFLVMAADIARYHHERWDGSGYPGGLSRHDIPLSARIVALADVYDAITSVRVYKSASDPCVSRTMIEQEEGRHFDSAVVEAFRASHDEFLGARHSFNQQHEVEPRVTECVAR